MTGTPDPVPMPDWSRVELVLVTYRSRAHIEAMLAGLPSDLPVVVVDNSDGADGLADMIRARPHGRYLSGGGVGFARAANLGARTSDAQTLVFVKPTARPTAADLATLIADVHAHPGSSATGGVFVEEDGSVQIGVGGWEPGIGRAAVHAVGLHKLVPRAGIYARPVAGRPESVDWINGGCMAVRRQTFLDLGCFDEDFYLFNEDVAFGRASRAAGMVQRLRTDVTVYAHLTGSGAAPLDLWRLRGASLSHYLRKYHGATSARLAVLVLVSGFVARAAANALSRDVDHARVHWAYAKGLVSGKGFMGGEVVMSRRGRGRGSLSP